MRRVGKDNAKACASTEQRLRAFGSWYLCILGLLLVLSSLFLCSEPYSRSNCRGFEGASPARGLFCTWSVASVWWANRADVCHSRNAVSYCSALVSPVQARVEIWDIGSGDSDSRGSPIRLFVTFVGTGVGLSVDWHRERPNNALHPTPSAGLMLCVIVGFASAAAAGELGRWTAGRKPCLSPQRGIRWIRNGSRTIPTRFPCQFSRRDMTLRLIQAYPFWSGMVQRRFSRSLDE